MDFSIFSVLHNADEKHDVNTDLRSETMESGRPLEFPDVVNVEVG